VGVLSSFAPGLPAQVAQAFADKALALAAGRLTSRGKFDDLAAGTAKLGIHDPVTQLDHQSLWQHNQDLAARLRLLLPPLPGSAPQQSADELRTLLSNLPAAIQHELADEWVPHELHKCSAGPADALSRLRPAPLSLLLEARRLSYEASRSAHQVEAAETEKLPHLRSDYLLLKALQRVVALHTMHHSVDGPAAGNVEVAAIRNRLFGSVQSIRNMERDIDTAFLSIPVLQSTYPSEVLDAASEYLHEAVAAVFQSGGPDGQRNSLGTPSDHLTVVWRCASCELLPAAVPPAQARLPPFGPFCTCMGLQWAWSELKPGGEAELERRAERRARWWVTRQGSTTKRPPVVFELLDLVQRVLLLRRPAT
jgi:hypothetical protein